MAPTDLTLLEQAALLRGGKCSSRELVDAHLARIEALDGKLHAFVEVYAAEARALADAADRARAARLPLPALHGLPIGLKDLCDIAGRIGRGDCPDAADPRAIRQDGYWPCDPADYFGNRL